jgi:hypothetical protein
MILTKAMLIHRRYMGMYFCLSPPQMKEIVDRTVNVDDIAFNMLVAALTRLFPSSTS